MEDIDIAITSLETLRTQTAVVTGGARGLGAELCRALHGAGYNVIISDIDPGADATTLATELDPSGETAVVTTLDVTRPADFRRVLDECLSRFGSVQVLVNNAARTAVKPLMEIDPAHFNEILATNAGGCFAGCQIFGQHFKDSGYGRLINLASIAGQNGGTATGAHYAASKGAILTITKIFARELAPFGVTCNAIAPGPLDTPLVREVLGDAIDQAQANIPVGQLGDPGFIADLVVILASPKSSFATGACWDVNGGIYMR